jgi:hypothetical protein
VEAYFRSVQKPHLLKNLHNYVKLIFRYNAELYREGMKFKRAILTLYGTRYSRNKNVTLMLNLSLF